MKIPETYEEYLKTPKDKLKQIVEPDLNNAVKVNSDINKMIKNIEDEDVTDDQFFDDFFFDE